MRRRGASAGATVIVMVIMLMIASCTHPTAPRAPVEMVAVEAPSPVVDVVAPPAPVETAEPIEPPVPVEAPEPVILAPLGPPKTPVTLAPGLGTHLKSGVPIDLVVELETTAQGKVSPLAVVGTCTASFDLWNEVFLVRVPQPGTIPKDRAALTADGVISACTNRAAHDAAIAAAPRGATFRRLVRQK